MGADRLGVLRRVTVPAAFSGIVASVILAIASLAATLPAEAVAAARERGRARDLWATAEELVAELGGESTDD